MKRPPSPEPAGLARRLAAIGYDCLPLLALLMLASLPWLLVFGDAPASRHPLYRLYQLYLLAAAFAFYGYFWLKAGQTVGMRAWRLRVRSRNGGPLTLAQAATRFLTALAFWLPVALSAHLLLERKGGQHSSWLAVALWLPLLLNFLRSRLARDRLTWHDRWSGTELIHEPKRSANTADADHAGDEEQRGR